MQDAPPAPLRTLPYAPTHPPHPTPPHPTPPHPTPPHPTPPHPHHPQGGNGVQADFLVAKHFCDMEAIYTYEGGW
jgi:hypothetical protein